MTKPVYEHDEQDCFYWEKCMYRFSYIDNNGKWKGYSSDSLINLKQQVKALRLKHALITVREGCLSCGQNLVDDMPYIPRYT